MSDDYPPFGSLSPRPLSYRDMLEHIMRDPVLSQQFTPMRNVTQPNASGFGDHNQIGADSLAALEFFGFAPTGRTLNRWQGNEPAPSQRVRQGWGDAQPLIGWTERNRRAR